MQNGTPGAGNSLSLKILYCPDAVVCSQQRKGFRGPAVDADNFQIDAVGSGKDSAGSSQRMADIDVAGGQRFGLFGPGVQVRIGKMNSVGLKGIFKRSMPFLKN